ncbi:MAG: flavodoxin domain-containing protein [Candidatus Limnocylindria bacterium]
MRVLVTAASRHGGTGEIATIIGQALTDAGLETEVTPLRALDGVAGYNAVVLGSGVYVGRWIPEATDFVRRHEIELRARPVWLFSSGPIGSPEPKPEGDPAEVAELIASIRARGHRVFAGRLDKRRLGIGERLVVGAVHAQEGDFRDPDAITAWAREIAAQLTPVAVAS